MIALIFSSDNFYFKLMPCIGLVQMQPNYLLSIMFLLFVFCLSQISCFIISLGFLFVLQPQIYRCQEMRRYLRSILMIIFEYHCFYGLREGTFVLEDIINYNLMIQCLIIYLKSLGLYFMIYLLMRLQFQVIFIHHLFVCKIQ